MDTALYVELLDFAHELAEEVGGDWVFEVAADAQATRLILAGARSKWQGTDGRSKVDAKKNAVDLVTETDTAVESYIRQTIEGRYPAHKFIGEESYAAGEAPVLTDEITWIVDPIDGTMNFVHNNPFVACSIGIAHKKQPVVGVIAQPFLNRTFSARLGGGAYMNRNTPLPLTGGIPQPLAGLRECLVLAEWGSARGAQSMRAKADSFVRLAGDPENGVEQGIMVHALRTYGSSACNIAAVAAGEADVYWDIGCYPWDVCAGAIILQEAGGLASGSQEALAENQAFGECMMHRRYIFVRPVADDADHAKKRQVARELYKTVEPWSTGDMTQWAALVAASEAEAEVEAEAE